MPSQNKQPDKVRLHPRNRNRERYDLNALMLSRFELKQFVVRNKFGIETINFSNPRAVKLLNQAIIHHYYGIREWEFPDENLCPPVPGRADYLHYIADLLGESNSGLIPTGKDIICMDVGTGASCIYPIIGITEYGWRFIGSDIDERSIASAEKIVLANPTLTGKVEFRHQPNSKNIFKGILLQDEKIDLTICNPPFHSSIEDAEKGTQRKIQNLSGRKTKTPVLNFSGVGTELIYAGGERAFIETMIRESKMFSTNCHWFSSLVSKESNLKSIYSLLIKNDAKQVKTIPLGTGNKITRIVAWTFR